MTSYGPPENSYRKGDFSTNRSSQHKGSEELTLKQDCCRESCPLFRVPRHRTPSPPIYLSEELRKPCALSRVFLLFSGEKSVLLIKKKVPSRSGFPLSTYVVLKTRHVSPISTYVDIRATYVVQTYLPLVRNFYPCAEQQANRFEQQTYTYYDKTEYQPFQPAFGLATKGRRVGSRAIPFLRP